MKEVQKVLGVASPVIGKTPNLKDLAERWTDKLSKLRQVLLLKSQYLAEHAMHKDYQP